MTAQSRRTGGRRLVPARSRSGSGDVYGLDARISGRRRPPGRGRNRRSKRCDRHARPLHAARCRTASSPAVGWSLAVLLTRADRVDLRRGDDGRWPVSGSDVVHQCERDRPRGASDSRRGRAPLAAARVATPRRRPRRRGVGRARRELRDRRPHRVDPRRLGGVARGSARPSAPRESDARSSLRSRSLSVLVAVGGSRAGSNPTHSQSLLYFVVSLEPWPFYLALVGIAIVIVALGPWLAAQRAASRRSLPGCVLLIVSAAGLEPSAVTAFQARGGAAVAGVLLELFLWWRWIEKQAHSARVTFDSRRPADVLLVAVPVLFVDRHGRGERSAGEELVAQHGCIPVGGRWEPGCPRTRPMRCRQVTVPCSGAGRAARCRCS